MVNLKYEEISEFRILPMNAEDENSGISISDFQRQFFFYDLPKRNGIYYFQKKGIKALEDALIFFQYKKCIVGMAKYLDIFRFEEPMEEKYHGYIRIDLNGLYIFDEITEEELFKTGIRNKDGNRVAFGNPKHHLEVSKPSYKKLLSILKNVKLYNYKDDNDYDDNIENILKINANGIKLETIKNIRKPKRGFKDAKGFFRRDALIGAKVILKKGFKCELGSDHVSFTSRIADKNYVEAHHLVPMEQQDNFDYSLDIEENIIALCPTCHRKLHHGKYSEIASKITMLYYDRKENLMEKGIVIELEKLLLYYEK
jgi:hypothetical protein